MDLGNLTDIISSLSDKDIENLKETAQQFFANTETNKEENTDNNFQGIDPASIGKIARIMSLMNSSSSNPRCELIKALKPLLKDDRRHKADKAMQIMKIFEILPLLK